MAGRKVSAWNHGQLERPSDTANNVVIEYLILNHLLAGALMTKPFFPCFLHFSLFSHFSENLLLMVVRRKRFIGVIAHEAS